MRDWADICVASRMQRDQEAKHQQAKGDWLGIGALVMLVGVMVWWWHYPFPDGKRPDFLDFLMFWGREAVLVIVFGALLAVVGIVVLVRAAWRLLARVVAGKWRGH